MSERSLPEILDAMEETMLSLEGVLASLDREEWHAPTGCPGWDVQDVASHIIGLEDELAGVPVPEHHLPDGLTHVRHEDGRHLELPVDLRRGLAPEEMLAQFAASTRRGLALRRSSTRSPAELTDGPFGWRMPYARLMSIRTFDCFAHEQDVRRAVGRPGNLEGQAAGLVSDLMVEILTGLLPTRVEELGDHAVSFEIRPPCPQRSREIVAGRQTEEGNEGATVNLPFSELVALVCGRSDVDETAVVIGGNEDLARRTLAVMAVTP